MRAVSGHFEFTKFGGMYRGHFAIEKIFYQTFALIRVRRRKTTRNRQFWNPTENLKNLYRR